MIKRIGMAAVLGLLLTAAAQGQTMPQLVDFLGATPCSTSAGEAGGESGSSTQSYCQATCHDYTIVSITCGGTPIWMCTT